MTRQDASWHTFVINIGEILAGRGEDFIASHLMNPLLGPAPCRPKWGMSEDLSNVLTNDRTGGPSIASAAR